MLLYSVLVLHKKRPTSYGKQIGLDIKKPLASLSENLKK
jgi:hypothetical protein